MFQINTSKSKFLLAIFLTASLSAQFALACGSTQTEFERELAARPAIGLDNAEVRNGDLVGVVHSSGLAVGFLVSRFEAPNGRFAVKIRQVLPDGKLVPFYFESRNAFPALLLQKKSLSLPAQNGSTIEFAADVAVSKTQGLLLENKGVVLAVLGENLAIVRWDIFGDKVLKCPEIDVVDVKKLTVANNSVDPRARTPSDARFSSVFGDAPITP